MDDNQTQDPLQPEETTEDVQQTKPDASDQLTEDHPRFKQVLDRAKKAEEGNEKLARELQELKQQIQDQQSRQTTDDDELDEDQRRAIDRIDRELAKRGYVRKEDLEVTERGNTLKSLGEEYNGKNGYPKFDSVDVIEYAAQQGYGKNYKAAYMDMHRDAIIQVEAERRAKGITVPDSEQATGGSGRIPNTEVTPDQIAKMTDAQYEKYREQILGGIQKSARNASRTY